MSTEPTCAECGTKKPILYRDKGDWHCLDEDRCKANLAKTKKKPKK